MADGFVRFCLVPQALFGCSGRCEVHAVVAGSNQRALGGWALGMAGLGVWLTRRRSNKNKAASGHANG
ncbi:MAG: hypothetical protein ABI627_14190 [Polyangiaceae bacterium]